MKTKFHAETLILAIVVLISAYATPSVKAQAVPTWSVEWAKILSQSMSIDILKRS